VGSKAVAIVKTALTARDPQGICDAARVLAGNTATEDGGPRRARRCRRCHRCSATCRRARNGASGMMHSFSELVIGGVLLAPFITYAAASLVIILALRPILRVLRIREIFSHPSIAGLSLYVVILGLLTVFL
jgi:hypothetical protein